VKTKNSLEKQHFPMCCQQDNVNSLEISSIFALTRRWSSIFFRVFLVFSLLFAKRSAQEMLAKLTENRRWPLSVKDVDASSNRIIVVQF